MCINAFIYSIINRIKKGKKSHLQIRDPRNKLFVNKYDQVECRKLIFCERCSRNYYTELSKIKTISYNIVVCLYNNPINACNTFCYIIILRGWFTYFDVRANTAYTLYYVVYIIMFRIVHIPITIDNIDFFRSDYNITGIMYARSRVYNIY